MNLWNIIIHFKPVTIIFENIYALYVYYDVVYYALYIKALSNVLLKIQFLEFQMIANSMLLAISM